ncbi:MAG: hypothetical protein WBF34_19320 [Streptosporangiaceae bacterium]
MTQDQYGQTRGPGYVARDDAVPDNEYEENASGQSRPKTAFQKVASALRGGPEQDQTAADQVTDAPVAADPDTPSASAPRVTQQDEASMAGRPISRQAQPSGDYWDEPGTSAADRDEAATVTNPDVPLPETSADPLTRQNQVTGQVAPGAEEHAATQPDMFDTTTHAGNGATTAPYPEGQAGEATNGASAGGVPVGDVRAGDVPVGDVPAGDVPAGEVTETAGRHAAAAPAGTESRPGEAAGALGDFSDLTYGNLLPDTTVYVDQWQQVQFKFVDDPHASVTEAADIIAQVTAKMEAAIQERQRAIEERQRAIAEQQRSLRGRWGEGTNADTEALRETLRMYKTFLDQLIGARASSR